MPGRFVDWVRGLTAKSTTIDGTEQVHLDSTGLSQKALLSDVIRYGGGSTRNTTAGNATVTRTTDGAIYLEVSGQTAGNARGAGAFDWQAIRVSATRVASGANALAIGQNCTASGLASVALGSFSQATGQGSFSAGSGQATGGYAFAYGLNVVSANNSQFSGGNIPTALSAVGGGQWSIQSFITVTTDATSTVLNITNTATDRMVIPATRSVAFIGIVQAMCNVSSSSNFIKAWKIEGVITRDGSNTTRIVGTPVITVMAQDADGTQTPSTWAVASITANDTNEALSITVTGQTGQTIRWQASLFYSQVGF